MASGHENLPDVLFGSFSERDVIELYQNKTSDLRFVWQERGTLSSRCALYGSNLVLQVPTAATHTPGVLSPNIPPNPPTSPVDGNYDMLSNRGGLASKLNVNAVPFIPGAGTLIGTGAINNLDVAKNSTSQSNSDAQGQSDSDKALSGALEKLNTDDQPKLPGVVVQTVGEPSCNLGSESNSRVVIESDSHSRTDPHLNAAQQNSRTHSDSREQSPAELHLDLSTTSQPLEDSQRTQPLSSSIRSGSPSCSVSSDTERQHGVQNMVPQAQDQALPTNQANSGHRSHTHSPTPTPTSPPPHTPTSPSHTLTPSHTNDRPPPPSPLQASSDQEKLKSQETQQQALTQPSSQSCSPGSVSSLSSTSLTSTVPSTAGSTASGSGGIKTKSWASIVSKKASTSSQPAGQVSQTSLTGSAQANKRGGSEGAPSQDHVAMATDGQGREEGMPPLNPAKSRAQLVNLGNQLLRWKVNHTPVSIQPKGLINQGNWCYMHAPLQALLSCPAVYNLLRLFSPFPTLSRDPSPSPVTNTIAQFMHEFKPYAKVDPLPGQQLPSSAKKKRPSSRPELHHGEPFRPTYVYEMLTKISSTLSTKGRQEDAEEFLGCVLDKLHEEMIAAKRAVSEGEKASDTDGGVSGAKPGADGGKGRGGKEEELKGSSGSVGGDGGEGSEAGGGEEKEEEEWEQVGPKNKSTITRQTSFLDSPITEIFGGELRSAVHRHGAKESATVEPFFSLQLDIQSDNIWSVKDALEALAMKETVRMSEVDAHKRITIARLPPILILHLKRFVFNLTGGSQKLQKHVQYNIDLEVGKDLLSPLIRNKLTSSQRSYKLWAVVYHHGKSSTGGHYTADVFHPACGGWVRADDSLIRSIPEDFVLKPGGSAGVNKVAYLLIYRRKDTIISS